MSYNTVLAARNAARLAAWKDPVLIAVASADVDPVGEQTLQGVGLFVGDAVLITDGAEGGIRIVQSGAWARREDALKVGHLRQGTTVRVLAGTNAGVWKLNTAGTVEPGVTSQTWSLDAGGGGGGGALPSNAVPSSVGAAGTPGVAATYSRSDHVHPHGALAGGNMHAVVIAGGANGFMSGTDKTKLDGIAAGATNDTAQLATITSGLSYLQNYAMALYNAAIDWGIAQVWIDLTNVVPMTASTVLPFEILIEVDSPDVINTTPENSRSAVHETLIVRVLVLRNGASVATFHVEGGGSASWTIGAGGLLAGIQAQLVDVSGAWKLQVRRAASGGGFTGTTQVRASIRPIGAAVPWTADTSPTFQVIGASVGSAYTFGDGLVESGGDVDIDLTDTTVFAPAAATASRVPVLDASARLVAAGLIRTSADVTISTTTSGNIAVTSVGTLTLTGTALAANYSTSFVATGARPSTDVRPPPFHVVVGRATTLASGSTTAANKPGPHAAIALGRGQTEGTDEPGSLFIGLGNRVGSSIAGGVIFGDGAEVGTPGTDAYRPFTTELCRFRTFGGEFGIDAGYLFLRSTLGGVTVRSAGAIDMQIGVTSKTNITSSTTTIENTNVKLGSTGGNVGFYGATAAAKPAITGSRGGNAALASLLTALATLGLITDSTTA